MKKILLIIVSIIIIAVIITFSKYPLFKATKEKNSLNISVLDIGKADSIVLKINDKNLLIDTGESDNAKDILNFLSKNKISTLDYMIITHFDKDHVGGASTILDNINVKNIIQPSYEKDSKTYNSYIKSLNENNIKPNMLTKTMSFNLYNAELTIYPPNKTEYKESDNDFSLVVSVKHGNNSFLFTGDAEKERLNELINQGNLNHTFLKIPHHGKYNSNSEKFISAVNPKYAVITCSNKNPADKRIIDILNKNNIKTFLTQNGNVYCTSDGNEIYITQ